MDSNGYGGVLPVDQWKKCDAAVAHAWAVASELDRAVEDRWYSFGTDLSTYRAAVETYKRAIQTWATRLEQLKHGPVTDPRAIEKWVAFADGLDDNIRSTVADLNYTSISSAVKDVGAATANTITTGLAIGLPIIALVAGAILVLEFRR